MAPAEAARRRRPRCYPARAIGRGQQRGADQGDLAGQRDPHALDHDDRADHHEDEQRAEGVVSHSSMPSTGPPQPYGCAVHERAEVRTPSAPRAHDASVPAAAQQRPVRVGCRGRSGRGGVEDAGVDQALLGDVPAVVGVGDRERLELGAQLRAVARRREVADLLGEGVGVGAQAGGLAVVRLRT